MSTEKLPPFYVGQRVVAIRNSHVPGCFTKGQEFTVVDIRYRHCAWQVDTGHKADPSIFDTTKHKCHCGATEFSNPSGVHYAGADAFAPLTSTFQAITFTEIMETELTSVN